MNDDPRNLARRALAAAERSGEMLVATSSGYVEDEGELREITSGVTRIAPEVFRRNPTGYGRFFHPSVVQRGLGSTRGIELRVTTPDGRTYCIDGRNTLSSHTTPENESESHEGITPEHREKPSFQTRRSGVARARTSSTSRRFGPRSQTRRAPLWS